jgi:hypothetical protein
MDKRIRAKIGGALNDRPLGQQLWAADGKELVAENLTGCPVRQRPCVAYREIGFVSLKLYHPVHADNRKRDMRMRFAPQAKPGDQLAARERTSGRYAERLGISFGAKEREA